MATKPLERDVRKRVKAALTRHGFHFHSAVAGPFSKVGVEDETACIFGRYVLIESKNTATDKPTAPQIRNAKAAKESGALVLLVHHQNIDDFEDWVANILPYKWIATITCSLYWPDKWL